MRWFASVSVSVGL